MQKFHLWSLNWSSECLATVILVKSPRFNRQAISHIYGYVRYFIKNWGTLSNFPAARKLTIPKIQSENHMNINIYLTPQTEHPREQKNFSGILCQVRGCPNIFTNLSCSLLTGKSAEHTVTCISGRLIMSLHCHEWQELPLSTWRSYFQLLSFRETVTG